MANERLSSQIDLAVSPRTTASFEELNRQLLAVKANMQQLVETTKSLSQGDIPFIRELRGLQKELGALLGVMRSGNVNAQVNAAQATGDLNNRRFDDRTQGLRITANEVNALREYNRLARDGAILQESLARKRVEIISQIHDKERLALALEGSKLAAARALREGDTQRLANINQQTAAIEAQIANVRKLERAWDQALNEDRKRTVQAMNAKPASPVLSQAEKDANTIARAQQLGVQRVTSDGGASIFAVQASLLSNYLVLNQVQNGFRFATQYSIEFERALKTLQAVTQSTNPQMVELQHAISQVSNSTKFSAVEIAEATVTLGQAGLSLAEIKQSLQSITLLATATGSDLGKAVDLVTSVMGAYKMTAGEAGTIADSVTQALNLSKLDVDKFQLAIQYAGNTAAQAGVQFNELLSAVSVMSNTGIRSGSTLGTGLRQLITDIEKPTKEFLETLQRLGLTEADVDLKSQGLYNALRNLHNAGFTASDALGSFEVRAAAAFNALNANLDSMADFEAQLNSTAAAARANSVQMESLGSQVSRFKSQAGLLASQAFKPLLDGFREFLSLSSDVMIALREMGVSTQVLATAMGAAGLGLVFGQLARLGVGLIGVFTAAPAAITATAAATTAAGAAAATASGGFAALAAAAGPIGFLVGALGAVALGAYATLKSSNELQKGYEEATTAVNRSKDALNSQRAALESVSSRLQSVQDRQANLKGQSFDREVEAVARQFEQYGRVLDTTAIKSTQDLIDKLKELQGQLRQEYSANFTQLDAQLQKQALAAQRLLPQMQRDLRENGAKDSGAPFAFYKLPNGQSVPNGYLPGRELTQFSIDPFANYMRALGIDNAQVDMFRSGIQGAVAGTPTADGLQAAIATLTQAQNKLATQALAAGPDSPVTKRADAQAAALSSILDQLGKMRAQVEMINNINIDRRANSLRRTEQDYEAKDPEALARGNRIARLEDEWRAAKTTFQALPRGAEAQDAIWKQMIRVESNGNQAAVSRKGAIGISQLMPDTGPEAARDAGLRWDEVKFRNDAQYNETLGRAYFDKLVRKYGGNTTLGAAAYNGGQGNVDKWLATIGDPRTGRITDSEFAAKIPFSETRNYVAKISTGLGPIGQLNRFQNSAAISKSIEDAAAEQKSLKAELDQVIAAREAATDDAVKATLGAKEKSLTNAISKVAKVVSEQKATASKLAKAAEPIQKRLAAMGDQTVEAQITELRKMQENTGDVADIEAIGKRVQELITQRGAARIEAQKAGRRAPGPGEDWDQEVKDAWDKINQEVEAELRAEDERTRAAVRRRLARIQSIDLAEQLEASNSAFQRDLSAFKNDAKARSKNVQANLKAIDLPVVSLQQQASMMSDPRFSGQYSSVQRASLAERQAAAEEATLQPKYDAIAAANNAAAADQQQLLDRIAEKERLITDLKARQKEYSRTLPEDDIKRVAATNELNQANIQLNQLVNEAQAREREITDYTAQQATLREKILALREREKPMTLQEGVAAANQQFLKNNDEVKTSIEGYAGLLNTSKGAFADFFTSLADGSAKAGSAFRTFATTIIRAMMDILAQQLAMAAIKGLIGMGQSLLSLGSTTQIAGAAPGTNVQMSTGDATIPMNMAATGGKLAGGNAVITGGFRRMASGGLITGGNIGRDSVPVLAQPGEIVMNRSAVSAVGEDFLLGLNSMGNTQISRSAATPPRETNSGKNQPGLVNVWIVSPDQQPSMGPNDVIAVVTDDISRGGSIKKLVKQVAMGQA